MLKLKELKRVISQIIKPLNNLDFKIVIEGLSGKKIYSLDLQKKNEKELLNKLKITCNQTLNKFNKSKITKIRVNEVGNYIEPIVK